MSRALKYIRGVKVKTTFIFYKLLSSPSLLPVCLYLLLTSLGYFSIFTNFDDSCSEPFKKVNINSLVDYLSRRNKVLVIDTLLSENNQHWFGLLPIPSFFSKVWGGLPTKVMDKKITFQILLAGTSSLKQNLMVQVLSKSHCSIMCDAQQKHYFSDGSRKIL